jgi:catechol 2,3-dioxygenase-like lactoylglutathione lyase family enzyme
MAVAIQITFDCADPDRLAHFWADVLGYQLDTPPAGYDSWEAWLTERGVPESEWNRASAVSDPDGHGPRIYFQRVPEPKERKNRVHLDVNAAGPPGGRPDDERRAALDAAVERAVGLGATKVRFVEEMGERHYVMQDIEGNEFCLQ